MVPLSIVSKQKRRILASALLLAALATGDATTGTAEEQSVSSNTRQRKASAGAKEQDMGDKQSRGLVYTDFKLSFSGDDVRGGAGAPNPGGTRDSSGTLLKGKAEYRNSPSTASNETESRVFGDTTAVDEGESRIIGGTPVADNAYPFFVQWNRGCGGTLIDTDLVLTAAHCYAAGDTKNTVWVGATASEQGRQRFIVEYMIHPQYEKDTESNDFLILRLNEPVRGAIQPVVLNTGTNYRAPTNGEQLNVIGFGVTDFVTKYTPKTLMSANVNYIANCQAQSAYEPGVVNADIMFCAGVPANNAGGASDSCQGDSGGPIMNAQKKQIGIVSFGRGCGESEFPGVYSRISAAGPWIDQMRCSSKFNAPSDCVDIRIDITYDQYPLESSWILYDSNGNAIHTSSTGEVQQGGLTSRGFKVRPGSYRLAVYDKAGDGICCIYGEGSISIFTGNRVVESSGIFGHETNVNFQVSANSRAGFSAQAQNPVFGLTVSLRLTINYDDFPKETAWQLVNDNSGLVVDESVQGSHTTRGLWTKDYTHLNSGHYWFSISDSSYDGIAGSIKIEQLNGVGVVVSEKWSHPGDFGAFVEVDFEVN